MALAKKYADNPEWSAEKRMYEEIYISRTGRETKILDAGNGELGYTSGDGNIHVAFDHPIMQELSNRERKAFRAGVFCHEMLHQIFTDFGYLENRLSDMKGQKREVMSLFNNLLEDPAIEHRAPEVVGGSILKSLNFTILTIYEASDEIKSTDSPFEQLCNALIQFGDMGLIKGRLNEEAFRYFKEIAPDFNRMIKNSTSQDRTDIAEKWTELTRPLWEAEENLSETIQSIQESLSAPMCGDPTNVPESENTDEQEESGSTGSGNMKEGIDAEESSNDSGNDLNPEDLFVSKEEADQKARETLDIDTKSLLEVEKLIEDSMDEMEKELVSNVTPAKIPEVNMPEYSGRRNQVNQISSEGVRDAYMSLKNKLKKEIRILTKNLSVIFQNDIDTTIRATSGSFNLKRSLKQDTVKLFDKRKEKKNISDLAVTILVDQSGSMAGEKIIRARDASIILAETFSNLSIPSQIIGFTADHDGYDAIHNHYVSFRNLAIERASLVNMKACYNNFDGFSIRYAGRLTQKCNAVHKILFVISDGIPLCQNYWERNSGIKDTTLAIREMQRLMHVIGIGIGDVPDDVFNKMYEGHFVHTEPEKLTGEIIRQLKKVIKSS